MNPDKTKFEDELKQAQKDSVAEAFEQNFSRDGLADIGIDALESVETLLKRFYEIEKPDQPLACAAGCTFCCHQYVGLSMPELAVVVKYIQANFDADQQQHLLDHLSETINATTGMGQFERAASGIDCPLLDSDTRQCSVYAARPLTCRGMHSLDREACEQDDASPGKNHPIPQYESHKSIVRAIAIGLHLGIAEKNIASNELELANALLLALTSPDAIEQWIKGDDVFQSAVAPEK